jgi:hypothetical protein
MLVAAEPLVKLGILNVVASHLRHKLEASLDSNLEKKIRCFVKKLLPRASGYVFDGVSRCSKI